MPRNKQIRNRRRHVVARWLEGGEPPHERPSVGQLHAEGLVVLRVGDVPPWMEALELPAHDCTEAPDPCPWTRYRMIDYPTDHEETPTDGS